MAHCTCMAEIREACSHVVGLCLPYVSAQGLQTLKGLYLSQVIQRANKCLTHFNRLKILLLSYLSSVKAKGYK